MSQGSVLQKIPLTSLRNYVRVIQSENYICTNAAPKYEKAGNGCERNSAKKRVKRRLLPLEITQVLKLQECICFDAYGLYTFAGQFLDVFNEAIILLWLGCLRDGVVI